LKITNKFLKHKDIHKFTWSSTNCRSIIDYVVVHKKTATMLEDTHLYRGADIYTDPFLVVAKLAIPGRWKKNTLQKQGKEKQLMYIY
jgi:hypothetical protein